MDETAGHRNQFITSMCLPAAKQQRSWEYSCRRIRRSVVFTYSISPLGIQYAIDTITSYVKMIQSIWHSSVSI
jgi:hypothetical protein